MFQIIAALIFSSLSLGMLGSLVIWQRLVNIGDTLAHAIILSLVLEYFFHLPPTLGAIIVAIVFILSSSLFSSKAIEQNVSMIALSSSAISITLIISDLSSGNFKLKDFLIGDIFSSNLAEVIISGSLLIFLIIFIYLKLKEIVLISISEELASVNGVDTKKIKLLINIILAVSIAVSIQIIGVLLMTSFLIIPAAIARLYSKSPSRMILLSMLISLLSSLVALIISYNFDVGFSGCAVLCITFIYAASCLIRKRNS